jgi:hypothetical protein
MSDDPTKESAQNDPVSVETTGSESPVTPSEPLESSTTTDTPSLANNDNQGVKPENNPIIPTEPEKTLENQASVSKPNEIPLEIKDLQANPASNEISQPETPTAQIPVNEPLTSEPEIKTEPKAVEEVKPDPITEVAPVVAVVSKSKSLARELLIKARNMIQFRKRKKLDKIMTLFLKKSKITNDEVEKLLHVSDATAERYLNTLEKENKIKQSGKTGKAVSYSKI